MKIEEKYQELKNLIRSFGSLAVCFSGGVDSTFLLRAASDELGENVVALTAVSALIPESEVSESVSFCESNGIRQLIYYFDALKVEGVRNNPENRCYICKKNLIGNLKSMAEKEGFSVLAEGSNTDDDGDYRPGMQAVKELGVVSPLKECCLNKTEISLLSCQLGLPTWNKPSFACLASRFPYGDEITEEKLKAVELSEKFLKNLGFLQFRVRIHGHAARMEVLPEQFELVLNNKDLIYEKFKEFGFSYAALDLKGFRSGSMNETVKGVFHGTE